MAAADTPAIPGARYVHTNLVARDWRRLASFYEQVFGCLPVPPERDYAGPELEAGTGLPGARLRGVHLRLPDGSGIPPAGGPTLEIYQYEPAIAAAPPAVNRPGFGHIAFAVPDVAAAREAALSAGAQPLGAVVTLHPGPDRSVTWCYLTDLEGNIVELQAWT